MDSNLESEATFIANYSSKQNAAINIPIISLTFLKDLQRMNLALPKFGHPAFGMSRTLDEST